MYYLSLGFLVLLIITLKGVGMFVVKYFIMIVLIIFLLVILLITLIAIVNSIYSSLFPDPIETIKLINSCVLSKRRCCKCKRIENVIFITTNDPIANKNNYVKSHEYVCTICCEDTERLVISDSVWDYYKCNRFKSWLNEIKILKKKMEEERVRLLKEAVPDLFEDSSNEYEYEYEEQVFDKGDIMILSSKITDEIKRIIRNTSVDGLGEAIKLIKDDIPNNIYRKLSFINYHRNRLAHDSSYDALPILDAFIRTANEVLNFLRTKA